MPTLIATSIPTLIQTLIKDIRHGARMLVQNSGFTLVAVLALGTAANTSIFSLVNAILLRSLPFRAPSSLVMVREESPLSNHNVILPADYQDWKSRNHVFGDLAAVVDIFHLNLTGAGEPEELPAGAVSANFFQMIGVQPVIGRAFLPAEYTRGREHVVILSHQVWRRRFDANVRILGKSVTLNGEMYHVIGVLPADFSWNNRRTDVWVPYVFNPDPDYRSTSGRYRSAAAVAFVDGIDQAFLRRRQCV
jgi:putative ABC transport system permease protein